MSYKGALFVSYNHSLYFRIYVIFRLFISSAVAKDSGRKVNFCSTQSEIILFKQFELASREFRGSGEKERWDWLECVLGAATWP